MELKNKVIIVTGASSGIGAAAAELFAGHGANVVLGARRAERLSRLADGIAEKGGSAAALAGDVTDPAYAQALVDFAATRYGGLDGAFNNAGLVGELAPVAEMTETNWRAVMDTNLTAAFLAARAQVPALLRRGGGSLVFTASFVGHSNGGLPGMGAYAAAKAGLIGLTRSLAADHAADGIRVNALLPGGTKTEMAGDDPDVHAFIESLHPIRRMADPVEIAKAALFLMSDSASFVTGSPLVADGGVSVRFAG